MVNFNDKMVIESDFRDFNKNPLFQSVDGSHNVSLSYEDLFKGWSGLGDAASPLGAADVRLDSLWRASTLIMALDASNGYWRRSKRYDRLDPSEKSALSFYLGMAYSSAMARETLRCHRVVHLDEVLAIYSALRGVDYRKDRRPDIVGYNNKKMSKFGMKRYFIESKGRSSGFDSKAEKDSLSQLGKNSANSSNAKNQTGWGSAAGHFSLAPVYIASQAYFVKSAKRTSKNEGLLKARIKDPKSDMWVMTEFSDEQFMHLVDLASYSSSIRYLNSLATSSLMHWRELAVSQNIFNRIDVPLRSNFRSKGSDRESHKEELSPIYLKIPAWLIIEVANEVELRRNKNSLLGAIAGNEFVSSYMAVERQGSFSADGVMQINPEWVQNLIESKGTTSE